MRTVFSDDVQLFGLKNMSQSSNQSTSNQGRGGQQWRGGGHGWGRGRNWWRARGGRCQSQYFNHSGSTNRGRGKGIILCVFIFINSLNVVTYKR